MGKIAAAILSLTLAWPALGQPFQAITWNLESGESSFEWISKKLKETQSKSPVEIWAFQEFKSRGWDDSLRLSLPTRYRVVKGGTGRDDRLVLAIDTTRFKIIATEELHGMNPGMRVRSPLVAHLADTRSGKRFVFVNNHLYRSKAELRQKQAKQLADWAGRKEQPVIMAGDFNFDYDLDRRQGNRAYVAFTEGGMEWVKPAKPKKSTCHTRYNSILDFIFEKADGGWGVGSRVVELQGNCPDTRTTPDHKPVMGVFVPD